MIRTSSIGDIIFSLPMAFALKKTFPKSEITWLIDEKYLELVINDHLIDKVIQWPRSRWKTLWLKKNIFFFIAEFYYFINKLRKTRYDLVIDLQGLLRTNIFARFCHATERITLGSEFCGFLFADKIFIRDHSSRRISSEYFRLAKELKLRDNEFLPRFDLPKENKKKVIKKFNFKKGINFFVIAPFTTRPEKHWENSYWNKLVEMLVEKYQLQCIVLGRAESSEQKKLLNTLQDKSKSYVGKTTLLEAADIINLSKFLIGVDTGLTHMSVSLKKTTIALFGATCPYLDPIFLSTKVIWLNKKSNPYIKNSLKKSPINSLNEIQPETVLKELEKLYQTN